MNPTGHPHGNAPQALPPPLEPAPVSLDWLRQKVAGLPALPQALTEAQQMLSREGASVDACAACLGRDAALTARVLRLANSPFYGRAGRVATLHDAVILLGRRTLGTLLTTAAVSSGLGGRGCEGFDFRRFWRHTFGTAVAAQSLAMEQGSDDALAYTAGLLHDIGSLVLADHLPDAMAAALALAQAQGLPRHQAEQQVMGVDHAQVGALIATHWHFPAPVVDAIGLHHAAWLPARAGAAPGLTELVQVANLLADLLEPPQCVAGEAPAAVAPALWQRVGLTPAALDRVLARSAEGMAALSQALVP